LKFHVNNLFLFVFYVFITIFKNDIDIMIIFNFMKKL